MANASTKRRTKRTARARRAAREGVASGGLRVSRDVISRRLGDEVILVNLKTDRVYALNQTAARFWELLASRRSIQSIERQLMREFTVEPSKLGRHISGLLSTLKAKKLIHGGRRVG
jgi:predicted methyltransferase